MSLAVNEVLKYCKTCQKGPFSSAYNAEAHFSSQQHKEAEAKQVSLQIDSLSHFFCRVCSEQCNGPKSFMEHMASPRHKVKMDKSQQFQVSSEQYDTAGRPYDFDGKRGYCHICRIDLTSPENASQHLNGEKHKKKSNQMQSPPQQTRKCNACNITFPDDASSELHIRNFHTTKKTEAQLSMKLSFNEANSFTSSSLQTDQPKSGDDLDKLFQNFQLELQNETPPQSVLENLSKRSGYGDADVEFTFNISTGFCNVCQVELTSIKNRDQHLSGAKHKKAKEAWFLRKKNETRSMSKVQPESQQRAQFSTVSLSSPLHEEVEYEFEGESGFCNVCKLKLTSIEQASAHLNSALHKQAKEGWMQADLSLTKNSAEPLSPLTIPPHSFILPIQNKPLNMSKLSPASPVSKPTLKKSEEPDYTFAGSRGYCNICDLELTSKQHADQHLKGAKHHKAKNAMNVQVLVQDVDPVARQSSTSSQEYTFNGKQGFCNLCNLELTSKVPADQHLRGAKHAKMKNAQAVKPSVTTGISARSDMRGTGGEEYTFNGSRGYCNVCKIELTSKLHADSHLKGKNHAKAKHRWLQGITENVPQFCEICQIACSGPESMHQHLVSKKHIEKAGLAASNQSAYNEFPVRTVDTSDNTKWFTCSFCNCKLNSQQQLETHKNSPKHKAQEEKMIRQCTTGIVNQQTGFDTDRRYNPQQGQLGQNLGQNLGHNLGRGYYENVPEKQNPMPGIYVGSQFNHTNFQLKSSTIVTPSCVIPLPKVNGISSEVTLPQAEYLPPTSVTKQTYDITINAVTQNGINASEVVAELPANPVIKNGVINSNSNEDLPSLMPFSTSLVSHLTLGSLRDDESVLKIDDEKSMFTMARPKVFTTNLSDKNIRGQAEVNHYPHLTDEQTNVKTIPSIEKSPIIQRKSDFNLASASNDKEETSKSLQFKSCKSTIDKISNDLHGIDSENPEESDSEHSTTDSSLSVSDREEPREKEIVIPEKTCNKLPMFGDKYFIVSEPSDLSVSSRSKSSGSRKSSGSEEARAIKNRCKSKQSSFSGADTSLDSLSELSLNAVTENVFEETPGVKNIQDNSDESLESIQNSFARSTTPLSCEVSGRNRDRHSPFAFYCSTCERPMNTEKSYKEHLRGQRHCEKAAKETAPEREHPLTVKSMNDYGRIGFKLTTTTPRSYQIELFNKAMDSDRVCFLPTGTGKTLISCMTISAMLEQNPTRQVMFLVDKVLLVLQQSEYIRREIGDRKYTRFSHTDFSKLEERKPVIAALCGGLQKSGGVPLWKHDVIIVTAAFYENLLLNKILRWNDTCLVVFDETHHCIKNHPFNKLLQGYHRKCPKQTRPKLLGLTASPAGRDSVKETIMMLKLLMDNLEGAMIALVEENTYELKKFQSSAQIDPQYIAMSSKERSFKEELQLYLLKCYMRLGEETDLLQHFDIGLTSKTKHLTEEELLNCAKEVDGSLLNSLEMTINMARPKEASKSGVKLFSRNIIKHTQNICIALNVLIESGVYMAIEELQELMAAEPSANFEFAEAILLPCTRIKDALQTCMNVEGPNLSLQNPDLDTSPQLSKLVEIVTRPDYVNWSNKDAMVLVLVKQRETAFKMKQLLRSHDSIQKLQLKVEAVVGHGTTSGTEQGMTVAQQKQILDDMKRKAIDIVVATSVAEEGVDIPECELVITFNPPSTVTALVQMRGRARKNNSKFVVLCNNSKEKTELEDLMKKERNMIEAAEVIVKEQKTRKL
ncbi:uncharacterized protein LOC127705998 [Mytilus californianus]|uniref:uncharacterized protein LOC127705998 n=1 Tax=Mytilus californianus TaxID=6549 RepID=UPI0022482644|nr:uncharacterized protein LOC127705998 [Mytilus californianus]